MIKSIYNFFYIIFSKKIYTNIILLIIILILMIKIVKLIKNLIINCKLKQLDLVEC